MSSPPVSNFLSIQFIEAPFVEYPECQTDSIRITNPHISVLPQVYDIPQKQKEKTSHLFIQKKKKKTKHSTDSEKLTKG